MSYTSKPANNTCPFRFHQRIRSTKETQFQKVMYSVCKQIGGGSNGGAIMIQVRGLGRDRGLANIHG